MMVLSIAAMILMTRKYVENWLIWVVIDVISVAIFAYQGLCHGAGVCVPDPYCIERFLVVDQECCTKSFTPTVYSRLITTRLTCGIA